MTNEVFTRLPGETESDARERLRLLRGETFKTREERIFEERYNSQKIQNRIELEGYGKQ